jgi:hypothetical protein
MQAVAELRVGLHREKSERRVIRPVEPEPVFAVYDLRPEKPVSPERPLHRVTHRPQGSRIGLGTNGDGLGDVVEKVEIVGIAAAGIGAVDDGASRKMAFGIPVRRQDAGNFLLKAG